MDGMYAGFAGAKTGYRRMTLNGRLFALAICSFGLATLAPLRRYHQCTVLAVRGEKSPGAILNSRRLAQRAEGRMPGVIRRENVSD